MILKCVSHYHFATFQLCGLARLFLSWILSGKLVVTSAPIGSLQPAYQIGALDSTSD